MIFNRLFRRGTAADTNSPSLLLELIVVALGVILALAAEQYWANLERERLIEQNLEAVAAELVANREVISTSYDYHADTSPKSFQALEKLQSTGEFVDASWFNGLKVPVVRRAAFDTALQMGVWAETDVATTAAINDAYACFERIETTAISYRTALAETRSTDGVRFFNVVGFAHSTLSEVEGRCLAAISIANSALERQAE